MTDLGLYDFGDGGGARTRWQRSHAARKRQALAKRHRAEARANKKRAMAAARADLKKRQAKWKKGYDRKCAEAKAAGRPKPSKRGRPWRLGLEHSQVLDMTGWTFGRLTVIRSAPISMTMRTSQRCRVWVVKCSCGSPERYVNGTTLRQGNTKSCGCLLREWARTLGHRNGGRNRALPLSGKMLAAAKDLREAGNVKVARLLEQAAPTIRRKERRSASRKRRRKA